MTPNMREIVVSGLARGCDRCLVYVTKPGAAYSPLAIRMYRMGCRRAFRPDQDRIDL